jgi:hypothetical protein
VPVIGSCCQASLGSVVIGEFTRRALTGAPGAIVIAPRDYVQTPSPPREVGMAYDASPEPRRADRRPRLGRRAWGGDVTPHAPYGELAISSTTLDLLVVGSRGEHPIERLSTRSAALQLVASARCPLLVLTRSAPILAPRPPNGRDWP